MAESFIEIHLETLTNLFPNVDPDYLESIAIECEHDEEKLQRYIEDMLDPNSKHPTREDWINRRRTVRLETEFGKESWNIENFLKAIPDKDPHNYFFKVKADAESGRAHMDQSLAYLKKRILRICGLRQKLINNGWSLTKTVIQLEQRWRCSESCCSCFIRGRLMCDACYKQLVSIGKTSGASAEDSKSFFLEVEYIEHKEEIEDYLTSMTLKRMHKLEQARSTNMLAQCECCFDNEILPDETVSCSGGHLFCEPCVEKYVKVRIGDGMFTFPCMAGDCGDGLFRLKTVQAVMSPRDFSTFLRRQQLEEIRSAGIEGLESCPFCGFSNIVDETSKVFKCEEEECGRETCRKCKKGNHVPYDCDEFEKKEDRARKYVEDKLSEALIRECYNCHNKFIKDNAGCNHITCTSCGAHMCYVCRKALEVGQIYQHFVGQGGAPDGKRCPLYSNANLLHVEALESVAQAVEKEMQSSNTSVDVSSYVPTRIRGLPEMNGAPVMRDTVLKHTLNAVNLNGK